MKWPCLHTRLTLPRPNPAVGPQGLHLRGLERLAVDGRSQYVVQGWVITVQ